MFSFLISLSKSSPSLRISSLSSAAISAAMSSCSSSSCNSTTKKFDIFSVTTCWCRNRLISKQTHIRLVFQIAGWAQNWIILQVQLQLFVFLRRRTLKTSASTLRIAFSFCYFTDKPNTRKFAQANKVSNKPVEERHWSHFCSQIRCQYGVCDPPALLHKKTIGVARSERSQCHESTQWPVIAYLGQFCDATKIHSQEVQRSILLVMHAKSPSKA